MSNATPAKRPPAPATLDHLVYGVTDLLGAVEYIAAVTGVRPVEGGRHVGLGTRNYLLGLTPTAYLEVIALDPDHPAPAGTPVPFGLDRLAHDRLITWAVHPQDAAAAADASRRLGADHGELEEMSRLTTAGATLRWRLALADPDGVGALPWGGLAPFVIDWGGTPHPAAGLPRAGLESLTLTTPDVPSLTRLLGALGAGSEPPLRVVEGPAALHAVLAGPGGRLEL